MSSVKGQFGAVDEDQIKVQEEVHHQQFNESIMTDNIQVNELGFKIKMIMCVCFLLFFLGININTDHGAVPSAAKPIKIDLDLNNQ